MGLPAGPRLGAAYSPTERMVFRGSYGIMYSRRGAVGLMQLLPTTAEEVANSTGMIWYPGLLQDPKANIELGRISEGENYVERSREQIRKIVPERLRNSIASPLPGGRFH